MFLSPEGSCDFDKKTINFFQSNKKKTVKKEAKTTENKTAIKQNLSRNI